MTTTTVFGGTGDGRLEHQATDYADASVAPAGVVVTNGNIEAGQQNSGSDHTVRQGFLLFDTSGVPDSDTLTNVDLGLYGAFDFVFGSPISIKALAYDWSAGGLTTADQRNPTQLQALTELASLSSSIFTDSGYNTFTSAGAAFNSHINLTGTTYLMLASGGNVAGTPADVGAGDEYIEFFASDASGTTQDPKLVITHAGAGVGVTIPKFIYQYRLRRI